jgi:hypothetical protein
MRAALLMVLIVAASNAAGEVYRWVDEKGTVHYSNEAPPPGVKATPVDVDEPRAPVTESAECYPGRAPGAACGAARAHSGAAGGRAGCAECARAPRPRCPRVRGYSTRARSAALGFAHRQDYSYFPTATEPYTTTVTFLNGRVTEAERLRR